MSCVIGPGAEEGVFQRASEILETSERHIRTFFGNNLWQIVRIEEV